MLCISFHIWNGEFCTFVSIGGCIQWREKQKLKINIDDVKPLKVILDLLTCKDSKIIPSVW